MIIFKLCFWIFGQPKQGIEVQMLEWKCVLNALKQILHIISVVVVACFSEKKQLNFCADLLKMLRIYYGVAPVYGAVNDSVTIGKSTNIVSTRKLGFKF